MSDEVQASERTGRVGIQTLRSLDRVLQRDAARSAPDAKADPLS